MRGNASLSYATFAFLARFHALSRKKRTHDYRYVTDYGATDLWHVNIRDLVFIFKIRRTSSFFFECTWYVSVKRRCMRFFLAFSRWKLRYWNYIRTIFLFPRYCKDDGYDANGKVEEDGAAFFLKGKVIRSRYDALASSGLIRNFPRCSSIRYNFSCLRRSVDLFQFPVVARHRRI